LENKDSNTYPPRQTDVDEEEATIEPGRSDVPGGNAYHEGVLDDTGPAVDDDSFAGKEPNRVLGGYKATLHSESFYQDVWLVVVGDTDVTVLA